MYNCPISILVMVGTDTPQQILPLGVGWDGAVGHLGDENVPISASNHTQTPGTLPLAY